jgi:hypothetical protein
MPHPRRLFERGLFKYGGSAICNGCRLRLSGFGYLRKQANFQDHKFIRKFHLFFSAWLT